MVEQKNGTIRSVAWSELLPWLGIVRAFRVAISARALLLSAAGLLFMVVGWCLIGSLFGTDTIATAWLKDYAGCPWRAVTAAVPDRPALLGALCRRSECDFPPCGTPVCDMGPCLMVGKPKEIAGCGLGNPICGSWSILTTPAAAGLCHSPLPIRGAVSVLLCGVWAAAVWAFFGGAVCRIAAVQLAADEQVGFGAAIRYAGTKWFSYVGAPLFPVAGVILAAVPLMILGLIMRADVGMLLAGLLWPLAIAAGLVMTLLLLGLLFGWPLMWGTVSTEGTDCFDALSRSYAYSFQRPLHYLFYAFVAGVIGWLGWILVQNFASGVVWMAYWSAGWGAGEDRIASIIAGGESVSGVGRFGLGLVHFCAGCVKLLAVGYLFSYFWAAAAAIYLLLRRDVDATEMDEVFLDSDKNEEKFGLPEISTDQSGAPTAADDTPQPEDGE